MNFYNKARNNINENYRNIQLLIPEVLEIFGS
jgi:hypothetical protein